MKKLLIGIFALSTLGSAFSAHAKFGYTVEEDPGKNETYIKMYGAHAEDLYFRLSPAIVDSKAFHNGGRKVLNDSTGNELISCSIFVNMTQNHCTITLKNTIARDLKITPSRFVNNRENPKARYVLVSIGNIKNQGPAENLFKRIPSHEEGSTSRVSKIIKSESNYESPNWLSRQARNIVACSRLDRENEKKEFNCSISLVKLD